jgi:hypothetical protein
MMQPIWIPRFAVPARAVCECRRKEMDLEYKTVRMTWRVNAGSHVKTGEVLCEAETEKCLVEVLSPSEGILAVRCVPDGAYCGIRQAIGYIDCGKEQTHKAETEI